MIEEGRMDLIGLIAFISKLRWAGLILGLVLAFGASPPPISISGVLGITASMLTYNLLGSRVHHLRPEWVEKLALGLVLGDFAACTGWVLLLGNAPFSGTLVVLALVGFEIGIMYAWRGALAFSAGFVLVLVALQVERKLLFGFGVDPLTVLFQTLVILLIAALAAGAASVLRRQRHALAEANERLAANEGRLRAVIDTTAIGICQIGLDGIIQDCNATMAAMLGFEPADLVGHSLEYVARPGDESGRLALLEELHSGSRSSFSMERRLHRRDGEALWVQLTLSLVKDKAGRPLYQVAAIQDIGERKKAEAVRDQAMRELERLNRLQRDFVSVVSHEFRTALTGISGFAQLIQEAELPFEEVKAYAGDIVLDSDRINRMINDVLDLDKMEAGRMPIRLERLDLNNLLSDAAERAVASSPKHSFRLELASGLSPLVADQDRLAQVMANLLSNAVKYSPKGGEIVVSSRREGNTVRVSVRDSGVGIPADALQRVFERYARLEEESTRHVGGTGLGLPIVKELVRLHGGRVWVESELGRGSTFHFVLPLDLAGETFRPLSKTGDQPSMPTA
ncbi:MAG: ATP-binding protein [Candidatus Dormibacteraceae bacterium]